MNWHPFAEKFPALPQEEWEVFKESIKKSKGNRQPVLYRIDKGKRQGLDGRNRERACQELGLECRYEEVVVADDEVKEFILDHNVHRRHMTLEMRRDIVAELRADGKSERAIAKTLGISQSTAHRDVQATESNESVETIIGENDKAYSPHSERAKRLPLDGPNTFPIDELLARREASQQSGTDANVENEETTGRDDSEHIKDEGQTQAKSQEYPEHLQPYFADNSDFDKASKMANGLTILLEKLEQSPAAKKALKGSKNGLCSKNTKGIPGRIAEVKPLRVCQKCDGAVSTSDAYSCDLCNCNGYIVAKDVEREKAWIAGAKK